MQIVLLNEKIASAYLFIEEDDDSMLVVDAYEASDISSDVAFNVSFFEGMAIQEKEDLAIQKILDVDNDTNIENEVPEVGVDSCEKIEKAVLDVEIALEKT